MKITVLLENSTPNDRLCAKHGLSLFIEGAGRRILFDMGPDASFLDNARSLRTDATQVDFAVISHGHFDHGGGLRAFLEATEGAASPAPVYIHERAFESHRANTPVGLKDIGIDEALATEYAHRFSLVSDELCIDENLLLFANVEPAELAPKSNAVLLERIDPASHDEDVAAYQPDAFAHEQSLLITEDGKTTLVTGCSHCGIVNIVKKAEALVGGPLHAVVAGFHLMNPSSGDVEDPAVVAQVAAFMKARPTRYFTFHCTGPSAYSMLRDALGDQVSYLPAGSIIEL
ncbi:MAG: MBL fold metallo-hydrolase [Eggerthellaceae bacterium]|nr:MBL fold metallo-hydrolase [Eggerthellaceae bacterium]